MVYRRPCVATDCGGSPELLVDGDCGLIVPSGDPAALATAISNLYRDPALRQQLGDAARERIRDHFKIENTIEQTLDVYRSLVT